MDPLPSCFNELGNVSRFNRLLADYILAGPSVADVESSTCHAVFMSIQSMSTGVSLAPFRSVSTSSPKIPKSTILKFAWRSGRGVSYV